MQRQASFRIRKDADLHSLIAGGFGFNSVHVLVNKTRTQLGRKVLQRNTVLDELCKLHAQILAGDTEVFHSVDSVQELRDLVNSEHAGETVQSGSSIVQMHQESLKTKQSAFQNIVGRDFTEFGAATAKGKDGKLYMVQLFRGASRETQEEKEAVFDLGDMCPQPALARKESQACTEASTDCETTDCETLEDSTDCSSFTEGQLCAV